MNRSISGRLPPGVRGGYSVHGLPGLRGMVGVEGMPCDVSGVRGVCGAACPVRVTHCGVLGMDSWGRGV